MTRHIWSLNKAAVLAMASRTLAIGFFFEALRRGAY
jgi:hypothetical protein|tara:strand:- start:2443 stop:2550 length:108 start_codon:yes stop_codon:yes gene_type:complete